MWESNQVKRSMILTAIVCRGFASKDQILIYDPVTVMNDEYWQQIYWCWKLLALPEVKCKQRLKEIRHAQSSRVKSMSFVTDALERTEQSCSMRKCLKLNQKIWTNPLFQNLLSKETKCCDLSDQNIHSSRRHETCFSISDNYKISNHSLRLGNSHQLERKSVNGYNAKTTDYVVNS